MSKLLTDLIAPARYSCPDKTPSSKTLPPGNWRGLTPPSSRALGFVCNLSSERSSDRPPAGAPSENGVPGARGEGAGGASHFTGTTARVLANPS